MKPTPSMRARRLYPNSKGFRNAYMRGVVAAEQGKPVTACPYKRGPTWSQAWRMAWLRGYYSVTRENEEWT